MENVQVSQPELQHHSCNMSEHILRHDCITDYMRCLCPSLQAVSMPQAFDSAWSAVGGGPADLIFPDNFLGHWLAESTLSKIETPLGLDFIPNPLVSCLSRTSRVLVTAVATRALKPHVVVFYSKTLAQGNCKLKIQSLEKYIYMHFRLLSVRGEKICRKRSAMRFRTSKTRRARSSLIAASTLPLS